MLFDSAHFDAERTERKIRMLTATITAISVNAENLESIHFELFDSDDEGEVAMISTIDISQACYLSQFELSRSQTAYAQMIRAFANYTDIDSLVNQEFVSE